MRDKDDDVILIFKISKFNLKRTLKSLGSNVFIKCCLQVLDDLILKGEGCEPPLVQSLKKVTVIADFHGLTSKHLYRPGLQMIMDTFDHLKLVYPEFLKTLICTRCPRIFPVVWLLLTPFVEEATRLKIKVHTENDDETLEEIIKLIGLERIPDFLDGPFEIKLPFKNEEEPNSSISGIFNDLCLNENPSRNHLYKCITLAEASAIFSITIGPETGVLAWDFEIISSEKEASCVFTVEQTDKNGDKQVIKEKSMSTGSQSGTFQVEDDCKVLLSWKNMKNISVDVSFFCQVFTRDKFDGSMDSLQSATFSSDTPSRSSLMMFNNSTTSF